MLLIDKTALITGSAKGIGKATAELFSKHGAKLILVDRDMEKLEKIHEEFIKKNYPEPKIFHADVKNFEQIKSIFNELNNSKIFIDILVNNAGIMADSMLQMVQQPQVQSVYEVNVFGTIYFSQFAIKSMMRKRKGSIINISSIMGTKGYIGQTVYGSSKSAIIGFTQSLSKEIAPLNIRVNAVAPGFIETDLTLNTPPAVLEKTLSSIGMKRPGKPIDVANTILFLASDLSEYITGQVIGVDGGMII
ncbi:MAG: SDR family oxidoreductase [Bacteroidetes bacterium]|nr:SDR family oxidoreductase [Bacteroidota bacterium]